MNLTVQLLINWELYCSGRYTEYNCIFHLNAYGCTGIGRESNIYVRVKRNLITSSRYKQKIFSQINFYTFVAYGFNQFNIKITLSNLVAWWQGWIQLRLH